MDSVGTPELIIPVNASPHGYTMRPSEARNLAQADLVIWVGPALTPWLSGPVETLANVPGIIALSFREGEAFEGHDHGDDHNGDVHDGDDHADEGDHAEAEPIDPHLWLDPGNGAQDPENAQLYLDNAKRGQTAIALQEKAIATQHAPLKGAPFIVLHDGFHYFESHSGLEAVASVSTGDAANLGAARIRSRRDHLSDSGVVCAFSEPQIDTSLLDAVTDGLDVKGGILDPLGANLPLGPGQYPALLAGMADSMQACLSA